MSPDRRSPESGRSPDDGRASHGSPFETFLQGLFDKTRENLEAKASESMPQDLDTLFVSHEGRVSEDRVSEDRVSEDRVSEEEANPALPDLLRELFAHDIPQEQAVTRTAVPGPVEVVQTCSPAQLDAETAATLDRSFEALMEEHRRRRPRTPQPIPMGRTAAWTGLAAAGLIGMLYVWGQGLLDSDPDGRKPLFVLVDVDKPLDTSMDPGAISLAAAGAIEFTGVGDSKSPKKGGEE